MTAEEQMNEASTTRLTKIGWALAAFCLTYGHAPEVDACGGLFCGQPQPLQQQQPVDQTAERILFKVNDNSVSMVVQIAYAGSAPDFAWVLPLGQVPDPDSLSVFPQRALTTLDENTSLRFIMPACFAAGTPQAPAGVNATPGSAAAESDAAPAVTVHYRAEVGPYDVAAIESEDPMALYDWLRDNAFNVSPSMLPYIRTYTDEGMKFLALKLQKDKESNDIQPFRFDLPGTTPSIPLRMTGLAAEPEMSILVFVVGDTRFKGANWPDVDIADDQISWRVNGGSLETNWNALLARSIDEAGGQGWVTEFAGSTADIVSTLINTDYATQPETEAAEDLLDLIGDAPYVTRLHARLSAEEMTLDPIFRRNTAGDVSNIRQLTQEVEGQNQCPNQAPELDPCTYTSCGAGGLCRPIESDGASGPLAGCACLDGSTARTIVSPTSLNVQVDNRVAADVACQDLRMSFSNPGDITSDGVTMLDPCVNFDCGPAGECQAVNMTPTCVCDRGYVAFGSLRSDGSRSTVCVRPTIEVPEEFYEQRLPDLPEALPGGREGITNMNRPVVQPRMSDLSSTATPRPSSRTAPSPALVPTPRKPAGSNAPADGVQSAARDSGGCTLAPVDPSTWLGSLAYAGAVAAWFRSRRRRGDGA
jgi:hypothetical protein